MNLLEHYIKEIYKIKDVTERFKKTVNPSISEQVLLVYMHVNCYGVEEDVEKIFTFSQLKEVQEKGFYMA